MPLLAVDKLRKAYPVPGNATARQVVVDVEHFAIEPGEQVALAGGSGTGKTTLLNLIAGITRADSGAVVLDGVDQSRLSEPERDRLRAAKIGYVFQTFNLLQGYTALENVELGMMFGRGVDKARARRLLERVGLPDHMRHRPSELSVGQQQRTAVARALANRPMLVLADEPTGNLDAASAEGALGLIAEVCAESGAALLLVSHDPAVLGRFQRVVQLAKINRAAARGSVS